MLIIETPFVALRACMAESLHLAWRQQSRMRLWPRKRNWVWPTMSQRTVPAWVSGFERIRESQFIWGVQAIPSASVKNREGKNDLNTDFRLLVVDYHKAGKRLKVLWLEIKWQGKSMKYFSLISPYQGPTSSEDVSSEYAFTLTTMILWLWFTRWRIG